MKCVICNKEFTPNKFNIHTQKYCSKQCRNKADAEANREYMRIKRKMWKYLGRPMISKNGNSLLSSLKIITINGQQRIEGAVVLEKLITKQHG